MLDQWKDRTIYWRARELSCQWARANFTLAAEGARVANRQSILTIVSDGMDQSKFKIPRWKGIKVKALEKFPRPAMHVSGVWAHGHTVHLAVSTPDIPKDANTHIEALSRMVDTVLKVRGRLPQHLHIQLDNTPRDNKNQKVFRWAAHLVLNGIFRSANLSFLRKGHTHEDLDAIFGQLALEVAHSSFDSVADVIDVLMRKLRTVLISDFN